MNPRSLLISLDKSNNELNLGSLHTFDKMRVLLEQAMYTQYILFTCGKITNYDRKLTWIANEVLRLPQLLHSDNESLNTLYKIGIQSIIGLSKSIPQNTTNCATYEAIFNESIKTPDNIPFYKSSISSAFIKTFCACVLNIWDNVEYPNGKIYNASIFIPHEQVNQTRHEQNAYSYVNTVLMPIAVPDIDVNLKIGTTGLTALISMCNLQAFSIEDVMGIYASFALDHTKFNVPRSSSQYSMHAPVSRLPVSVSDVCFDMITGSEFVSGIAGNSVSDSLDFLRMIEQSVTSGRLQSVEDYSLFGDLLTKFHESAQLVNYFKKSVSEITSAEAKAYRNSPFVKFISDRFGPQMAGLTAIDDEQPDNTDTDDESVDTPENVDNKKVDTDPLGNTDGEPVDEDPLSDVGDDEEKAERDNPTLDPNLMLLELVQPTENMADYIYREMVGKRIASILKNPPQNAMPNDLLMLKRWRSRWLYLASIACLRDFMARISLRLSDTK